MEPAARFFRTFSSESEVKFAGLYDLGEKIGEGHFAVVRLASHVFTGEKVAVKVIDKTKLDALSKEHLFQEVMCMKLVQHPNVVRLYEVIDTVNKLYLVQELGDGGDMYDYIMKYKGGLDERDAKRYFHQIVTAIAYCHKLHVVHRDLKPENVVFFEKLGVVKLTDFGFSNKFTPGELLETSCGSLAYSAPEILLGDSYDAPKVDIWSLGVILYMLVCGRLPFQEATDGETLAKIMDCKYHLPLHLTPACRNLISRLLLRDPEQRITLDRILEEEWLAPEYNVHLQSISVPLISKEHISLDDHLDILNKMAEGNLAPVDDIQAALDKNEYTYLTATYFLLAERKLKRHYIEAARRAAQAWSAETGKDSPVKDPGLLHLAPPASAAIPAGQCSVRVLEQGSNNDAPEERLRRFSMILEDEEEEEDEEMCTLTSLMSVRQELENALSPDRLESSGLPGFFAPNPSRCASRTSATTATDYSDGAESDVSVKATGSSTCSGVVRHRQKKHRRQLHRPLVSVRSSPQLLKNICEEDPSPSSAVHADTAAQFNSSTVRSPSPLVVRLRQHCTTHLTSPNALRRIRRYSEGSGGSNGNRVAGASRSSSDNSDTEAETCASAARRSLGFKSGSRQDSDHSSDTDCGGAATAAKDSCNVRRGGSDSRHKHGGGSPGKHNGKQEGGGSGGKGHGHGVNSSGVIGSGCVAVVSVGVREKCAPISEEEEFRGVNSTSLVTAGDAGRGVKSDSADCTPARTSLNKLSNFSLSSTLTQSNFSLSSLTSSVRGSKVMMDVIRGTFEIPCQHYSHDRSAKKSHSIHSEISSLRSLPEKIGGSGNHHNSLSTTTLSRNNCNNNSVPCSGKNVFEKTKISLRPKMKSCCKVS